MLRANIDQNKIRMRRPVAHSHYIKRSLKICSS